jgi:hypothetical protein
MPKDKGTTKPITQLNSLQINYQDQNSCFNPPIVTTAERDALVNTDNPEKPIKDGTLVFNGDTGYQEYYSGGKWIEIKEGGGGSGNVSGPPRAVNGNLVAFDETSGKVIKDSGVSTNLVVSASSITVKKGQIPVWYNVAAGKINLANSGVTVDQIRQKRARKNVNATELYQISNLGALQFGSNDNVADTGIILVDGLTPVTFQTQGTGADSRVCTVINGELGEGSSSPSALLEINSSTGGFLHARMTTVERDALLDPKDGLEIYNTDTKNLNIRQDSSWVEIKSGGNGNVIGPPSSVANNIVSFDGTTGTLIKDSGFSTSFFRDNNFKNIMTFTGGTIGEPFPVKGIDSCKVTLVGAGGFGGKCVGGYQGCGGGAGAALVIYLKNLLSIPDFWVYMSSGFVYPDNTGVNGIFEIRANTYTTQVRFTAKNGQNGSDGSSSVTTGGAGGNYLVEQLGTIYTADNYNYIGFTGAFGHAATNSGVSGAGGVSILGGAGASVTGNNNGPMNPADNSGSGGSGGSGEGLSPQGVTSGIVIIEW